MSRAPQMKQLKRANIEQKIQTELKIIAGAEQMKKVVELLLL